MWSEILGRRLRALGHHPKAPGHRLRALGRRPRALGSLPRAVECWTWSESLGRRPGVLGRSPRALGRCLRALGRRPRALGILSRAVGRGPGVCDVVQEVSDVFRKARSRGLRVLDSLPGAVGRCPRAPGGSLGAMVRILVTIGVIPTLQQITQMIDFPKNTMTQFESYDCDVWADDGKDSYC